MKSKFDSMELLKDTSSSDEEEDKMPRKKSQHVLKDTRLSEEEMPLKKSQHYQVPINKGVYNLRCFIR